MVFTVAICQCKQYLTPLAWDLIFLKQKGYFMNDNMKFHIVPLRYEKRGYLRKCNGHPIVTCGSRVSRAPPHHPLPVFLNLHDSFRKKFEPYQFFICPILSHIQYMIFGIILSGDIKKTFRSMSSQLLIIYDYESLRKIPVNFRFSYKIRLALAYIGFTIVPMFIFVGQR